jgi:chemotaxis protein MotB
MLGAMKRALIVALGTLGLVGCVTKSEHQALQRELDQARATLSDENRNRGMAEARLDEREQQLDDVGQALLREENRARMLERQIASLQRMLDAKAQELAALERHLTDSQAELAEVLGKRARLEASVAEMTQAVAELGRRQAAADRRVAEYRDMLTRFAGLIDAGKLDVRIVDGRMVLTLPMDILFASGSARLSNDGRASLLELGAGLATIPDKRFQVEGHTDDVPIATERFPSNWELASARSLVVLHTLLGAGVGPEALSAASFGEHKPRADNRTDEGRASNRRIEIVVVPDLSGLPGFEELERLDAGRKPMARHGAEPVARR